MITVLALIANILLANVTSNWSHSCYNLFGLIGTKNAVSNSFNPTSTTQQTTFYNIVHASTEFLFFLEFCLQHKYSFSKRQWDSSLEYLIKIAGYSLSWLRSMLKLDCNNSVICLTHIYHFSFLYFGGPQSRIKVQNFRIFV